MPSPCNTGSTFISFKFPVYLQNISKSSIFFVACICWSTLSKDGNLDPLFSNFAACIFWSMLLVALSPGFFEIWSAARKHATWSEDVTSVTCFGWSTLAEGDSVSFYFQFIWSRIQALGEFCRSLHLNLLCNQLFLAFVHQYQHWHSLQWVPRHWPLLFVLTFNFATQLFRGNNVLSSTRHELLPNMPYVYLSSLSYSSICSAANLWKSIQSIVSLFSLHKSCSLLKSSTFSSTVNFPHLKLRYC